MVDPSTILGHFWESHFYASRNQMLRDANNVRSGPNMHDSAPQGLMREGGSLCRRIGVNLTVIQELMAHANIQTTARCVGIAGKEMRAAIEKLN